MNAKPKGENGRYYSKPSLKYSAWQVGALEQMEDNERMLVSDGAGTGKTLLACEAAARFARAVRYRVDHEG